MGEPFIGEIRIFANSFAPRGWAFCDGQMMSIGQHTTLFAVINTFYGGDGRTTFALPDLRGKVPMHWGRGPGLSPRQIAQNGGTSELVLTEYHMPSHTHTAVACKGGAEDASPTNGYFGNYKKTKNYKELPVTQPVTMSSSALAQAGLSRPHENKQPYTVLNFCMALVGLFPSRN